MVRGSVPPPWFADRICQSSAIMSGINAPVDDTGGRGMPILVYLVTQ